MSSQYVSTGKKIWKKNEAVKCFEIGTRKYLLENVALGFAKCNQFEVWRLNYRNEMRRKIPENRESEMSVN